MPWVPQNDILGNPSTKAFLSHMGANGLNEVRCWPCSCGLARAVRLRVCAQEAQHLQICSIGLHHGQNYRQMQESAVRMLALL